MCSEGKNVDINQLCEEYGLMTITEHNMQLESLRLRISEVLNTKQSLYDSLKDYIE